jgi:hypothetical protein
MKIPGICVNLGGLYNNWIYDEAIWNQRTVEIERLMLLEAPTAKGRRT